MTLKTTIFPEYSDQHTLSVLVQELPQGEIAIGFVHTSDIDNGGNGMIFTDHTTVDTVKVTVGETSVTFNKIPKTYSHALPDVSANSTFTLAVRTCMPTQKEFVLSIFNEKSADPCATICVTMHPTQVPDKRNANINAHFLRSQFPGTPEKPWFACTTCPFNY